MKLEDDMDSLHWNVIYRNATCRKIDTFNLFGHIRFAEEVRKQLKKCKCREEFAQELKKSVMYYFWGKCEWEILVSPWVGGNSTETIKIDPYWQVMNNWEIFVDYIWNTKSKK